MLSDLEHKLLVTFFAGVLFLSGVRTLEWSVLAYNHSVEQTEIQQQHPGQSVQFNSCMFSTPLFERILSFQIILLLFAFGLFLYRTFASIAASAFILSVILFGYLGWIAETHRWIRGSEHYAEAARIDLVTGLMYGSTVLDLTSFVSVVVLLIIQLAIGVRFIVEQSHARLRFR